MEREYDLQKILIENRANQFWFDITQVFEKYPDKISINSQTSNDKVEHER